MQIWKGKLTGLIGSIFTYKPLFYGDSIEKITEPLEILPIGKFKVKFKL